MRVVDRQSSAAIGETQDPRFDCTCRKLRGTVMDHDQQLAVSLARAVGTGNVGLLEQLYCNLRARCQRQRGLPEEGW